MNEKLAILSEYSSGPWGCSSYTDGLFKSLCLVFFLKFAKPRLLHRWAWATRNNLWKRSWHDTESDPLKWKYRNSQCNFGFPLTLPKATGFSKPLMRWGPMRCEPIWYLPPNNEWAGCFAGIRGIAWDQKPEKHIWHSMCVIASTAQTNVAPDSEEENSRRGCYDGGNTLKIISIFLGVR